MMNSSMEISKTLGKNPESSPPKHSTAEKQIGNQCKDTGDKEERVAQSSEANVPNYELENKFFSLKNGDCSLGYKYILFQRCELRQGMKSLTFFDGTIVQRPPIETVFKPGQEVFLCPSQRPKAIGKKFLLLGVFPNNPRNAFLARIALGCSGIRKNEKPRF